MRNGLEACRRSGGRLGTWLVRLGLINESTLLDALSQQTGCPAANALELTTSPFEVRALLPAPFAKRNVVVAFNRQGRNLDVAMANPNDLILIDEVARVTGLVPRPHVATEAALAAALAIPTTAPGQAGSAPPPGPPRGSVREWRQFWKLESTHADLIRALEQPAAEVPAFIAATFPHLAPLDAFAATTTETTEANDLADALSAVTHRDQVARLVLDFLAPHASRVALFSIQVGRAMGWAARGNGIVEEDFHNLILPLDRPSLLLNLASGADIHIGPLTGGEGNELLLEALGYPTPREAVVAPITVRGNTAGFVWVDCGEGTVAGVPIPLVQDAARLTGLALEILVLRQKIKGIGRLQETPRSPA
ncbi:MAG: hypothetical protein ACHQHM_06315 [Thermoanaerobaculales bacterium]